MSEDLAANGFEQTQDDDALRSRLLIVLGQLNWWAMLSNFDGRLTKEGRQGYNHVMNIARKMSVSTIMQAIMEHDYVAVAGNA